MPIPEPVCHVKINFADGEIFTMPFGEEKNADEYLKRLQKNTHVHSAIKLTPQELIEEREFGKLTRCP